MAAQHKRPGRKAKAERKRRADERARKKLKVVYGFPRRGQARDDYNIGRLVIWAEVVEDAKRKKESYRHKAGYRQQRPERFARTAQSAASN